MIRIIFYIFSLFIILEVHASNLSEREVIQKLYDHACEAAREKKLKPLRQEAIKDCVTNKKLEHKYCEKFYSTFGDARYVKNGMRPPMFSYLPECEKALKYKRSYRQ